MMKIRELRGAEAYKAHSVYYKLLLAIYMSGLCGRDCESHAEAVKRMLALDDKGRKQLFKNGFLAMEVEPDEIYALAKFASDKNDVPLGKEQLNTMTVPEISEIISEVCLAISKIEVFF